MCCVGVYYYIMLLVLGVVELVKLGYFVVLIVGGD